ncbi:DMT family transporter [Labrenzia sp. PHM005]|uniref:DMT family transporter n=1 Tax=Labrenzia sp. PHM005 TaxID=2590016 RepID=UPI001140359B|nr:DMT family transporter [Labrenzia sp. PHM005]QDG77344.1 DMT family transporter [Labrenzia sp. PHM005]
MERSTIETFAMVSVAAAGVAWGIFWIPLRALDDAGVVGAWAVVVFYVLPTLLLLPIIFLRRRQILDGGWPLQVAGILAGVALVCYAGALIFTEVVRATLFFYLTPIWSTLLAWIVLREPVTMPRWATIGLGVLGLLIIVRADAEIGGGLSSGDWMAIAGGLIWAVAAVVMKSDQDGSGIDFTLSYFAWGSVASLLLLVVPLEGAGPMPDWETMRSVLLWMVPVALLLVIPPAFAIMWGATVLSPGLIAILFMTEISAAAITAALWAGEPFGLRELSGVILISAAGIFEPVLNWHRQRT